MKRKLTLLLACLLTGIGLVIAQAPRKVTGTVISEEDNMPVVGASVLVKGTTVGTTTDMDGHFTITNVPSSAKTLKISYIGMQSQEVAIKATPMKVLLKSDAEVLDEVVVTGMTKMDKRLFTGASDQLKATDVMLSGMGDISRSLEGRSAGVSVQNISSTFGTAPKIRIRGATSILGNSKPLWVVDGVIMEDVTEVSPTDLTSGDAVTLISSAISGLNADDIESFNILKDGSATSIYGAKAMAGVIVVTTKKGREGTTRINYTGEFTTRMKPNYRDYNLLNSQDQMSVFTEMQAKGWLNLAETLRNSSSGVYGKMYQLINEYDATSGQFGMPYTEQAMNDYLRKAEFRNTDWFDGLFSNGVAMTHSVSMSSGTAKSNSYLSFSYMNDPGWYKQSEVQRYTFNANSTYNITDKLSFSILGNASYSNQKAPGTSSQDIDGVSGEVKRNFDISPFYYAMNTSRTMSGTESYMRNYASFNIFEELANNYIDKDVADVKFQAELRWKILKGLEFNSLVSYRYNSSTMQQHIKDDSNQARAYREMSDATIRDNNPFLYTDPDVSNSLPVSILPNGGIYEKREYKSKSYTVREALTWTQQFRDIHFLNVYGGMEITSVQRTNDWFRGWGMQYNEGNIPFYNYLAFKKGSEDNSDYYSLANTNRRSVAFFGTANYSYKGRYNLNGTLRYEGTNRLGKSTSARWLPTWNVGAAWNVHEEAFFEALRPALSFLNLKTSYSLTADAGPDYVSNSTSIVKSYTPWRPSANDKESGLTISYLGNSDLTYEKKHEFNIGLSVGFLDNRINLETDWYWRNNYDLIGYTNTQGVGGEVMKYANIADMKSRGIEFTLTTHNIKKQNFQWNTDLTFSWMNQKIKHLQSNANVMDLIRGTGYNLEGYAPYSLFSIPFTGLDADGFPTFEIGGTKITKDNYSLIDFQATDESILKSLKYEGPTDPTYTGGFGNLFTYKNWRLNLYVTYGFGNKIRLSPAFKSEYSDFDGMVGEFKNRWVVSGDEKLTDVPVIASSRQVEEYGSSYVKRGYNAYNYSSARVAKGDFVRMKEISLTYDFPKSLIARTRLNNLSLKIQAANLFLIYADSSLHGQDPEYYSSGGVSSPLSKQFTLTVRIGL